MVGVVPESGGWVTDGRYDPAQRMGVECTVAGPIARVRLTGEFDFGNTTRVQASLVEAVGEPGVQQVIIDLSELNFLDASGAGALIRAKRRADERGLSMYVIGAQGVPLLVLEILGAQDLLRRPSR
jgi:anti-anti-sigma factor